MNDNNQPHEELADLVCEYSHLADSCLYLGIKITDLTREELLAVLMSLADRYSDMIQYQVNRIR